jgi:exonuclease-1
MFTMIRYVDYAMHRVRLLQYHNIQPYIVFDGGPLPAKKNTESDRKQKREENLSRGNALAIQGKHREARECYVKCVDVTPQMAYQFIKARFFAFMNHRQLISKNTGSTRGEYSLCGGSI